MENVKTKIPDKKGMTCSQQKLISTGKQLEDRFSVSDYNIQNTFAFYLVQHLTCLTFLSALNF